MIGDDNGHRLADSDQVLTTALLAMLLVGAAIKLKLMGGAQ